MGGGGISQQILYRFQSELEERYTLTASLIRRRYKKCEDSTVQGGRPWLISLSLGANPLGSGYPYPSKEEKLGKSCSKVWKGICDRSLQVFPKKNNCTIFCDVFRNLCMEFLLDLPGNVHDPKLQAWRTGPKLQEVKYGFLSCNLRAPFGESRILIMLVVFVDCFINSSQFFVVLVSKSYWNQMSEFGWSQPFSDWKFLVLGAQVPWRQFRVVPSHTMMACAPCLSEG